MCRRAMRTPGCVGSIFGKSGRACRSGAGDRFGASAGQAETSWHESLLLFWQFIVAAGPSRADAALCPRRPRGAAHVLLALGTGAAAGVWNALLKVELSTTG